MGRFFDLARPEYVNDIIYQPPWQLMKDVIDTHDKRIDEQNKNLDESDKLLADINNLQNDDPEVNKIIGDYRNQINSISEGIQSDYSNYRQFIPEISRLKRKLQDDMDNGLLGRAQEAFNDREAERKRLQTTYKNADPKKVAAIMKYYDLNYKDRGNLGFKDKENYNKFITETLNPEDVFDTAKFLNGIQSHIEGNQTAYAGSGPGSGYIWSKQGTKYTVSKKKVRDTLENHPELKRWESTTKQDIMLKAHNELGLRGSELDSFVEQELGKRREEFIQAGIAQIVHDKETKRASASPDGKYMSDQAYARRQEDAGNSFVQYEVDVDKRSDEQIDNDNGLLNRISTRQAEGTGPLKTPELVEKYIIEKLPNTSLNMLAEQLGENPKVLSRYVQGLKRRGIYTNLVFPEPSDYERDGTLKPEAKVRLARKEKATRDLVLNTDASEITTFETGTNYRVDSKLSQSTFSEIFNDRYVKPSTLGGKSIEVTKNNIARSVTRKDKDGNNVQTYLDTKGNPIEDQDGNYATTPEQAMEYARQNGQKPMTESSKTYTDQAGHKFKVVGEAKVQRFQGKFGKPMIQVTVTSRSLSDGKVREIRAMYPEDKYKAMIK